MSKANRLHLTLKNVCAGVIALAGIALAVIVGVVPAENLNDWRWLIYSLGAVAALAALAQMFLQSREDKDLSRKIDEVLAGRGIEPKQQPTKLKGAQEIPIAGAKSEPGIDGEVYRIAKNPRGWSWKFLRDIYKLQGRPDEATIDTDILVEMYSVNRASDKVRYIRDLRLSAEIDGKRVDFKRQNDLSAADFNDHDFEYCLRSADGVAIPIHQLFSSLPLTLAPEQPIEGWVRFMAKDINPDKIVDGTVTLTIVDSLGKEYPIARVPEGRERDGEIALCRVRE